MAETYCGKTCAECPQKEILNCPGCKPGPGLNIHGDCELAQCCQSKHHADCSTCCSSGHCGLLQSSIRIPQFRLEKIAAEAAWEKEVAERAKKVYRWFWIMFWLIIPGSIASLLSIETITALWPGLKIPGLALNIVCNIATVICLFGLSPQEDRYKTAGICAIVCVLWDGVLIATANNATVSSWTAVLSIPILIVSFVRHYNEMIGHSVLLTGVDVELSENWAKLWKWLIRSYGAVIGGIVLSGIFRLLGILVLLAGAVGIIVVDVLKFIYLYRTANLFQEYL